MRRTPLRWLLQALILSSDSRLRAVARSHGGGHTELEVKREKVAQALVELWKHEDKVQAKPTFPGRSILRSNLVRWVDELSHAPLGGQNATCLEWGPLNYVLKFSNCKHILDLRHAVKPHTSAPKEDASGRLITTVKGDIQLGLAHVPTGIVDLIMCSMVFEHVPQTWRSIKTIARLVKPGGVILWGTPFVYRYHPIPGDFWRFTHQGNLYLLESAGLEACIMSTDGIRAAQLHTLGLSGQEADGELLRLAMRQ